MSSQFNLSGENKNPISLFQVTPTSARAVTYDEESWKPSPEDASKESKDERDSLRSSEIRQSKTKRVKNYLKKCKSVLGSSKSASLDVSSVSSDSVCGSSWYLEDNNSEIKEGKISELSDVFEDAQVSLNVKDCSSVFQVANVVEVRGPPESESYKTENLDKAINETITVSEGEEEIEIEIIRDDKVEESIEENENDYKVEAPQITSPVLKELQDQEDGGSRGIDEGCQQNIVEEGAVSMVSLNA